MGRRVFALALLAGVLVGLWRAVPGSPARTADAPQVLQEPPKLLALTFDDGPRRTTTARLLDGLSQRGVSATFFLIGKQIAGNEDLVRRMEEEGHQVGIHTFDHVSLSGLSRADFDLQVGKTREALTEVLGHGGFFLRPPYGVLDSAQRGWVGAPVILWSVDPEDWRDRNVQREVAAIVGTVKPGDIILLHDIFPESVDAALQVIDQLHQAGYSFVTVDTLLSAQGIVPQPGKTYRHAHPG